MKAHLRSTRIAPKKANLIAGIVRGLPVAEALSSLERINKKSARILENLLKSAIANAKQNDNQEADTLVVKSITVNKAQAYHRGVPMARGRVRPMRKFLSHITITLGVKGAEEETKKMPKTPSQEDAKPVKTPMKSEKSKSLPKETATAPSSASKSSTPKK